MSGLFLKKHILPAREFFKKAAKNIEVYRSAFCCLMTQTASMTTLTASGGFFMAFTIVISEGFRVFSADIAA